MTDKLPNQYLQAIEKVYESVVQAYKKLGIGVVPSKAEQLSKPVGDGVFWKSTIATTYASEMQEILNGIEYYISEDETDVVESYNREKAIPEVDPSSTDGWKTRFLNEGA